MPLLPTLGRTVGTSAKAARLLVRGSVRGSAWATRTVGTVRARGAANEVGMVRLFDLHALSCAGDTLIAIGLAGTIFFNVPLGEARSKVALYLLITMVPFALLAPVIGPLLDHFRHGRRYALAVTMLGRAFLAFLISDHLHGFALYPAVFGVLALSRAYGVARSAAVPRLLPAGIGLSQVGARASVYGTFAGAVVAPIGLAAFWFGPQWSLRVAAVIFVIGMVISLRLPPRADSDPPEAVPRPLRTMLRLRRGEDRPLSGSLIVSTLIGSASLRALYGFLLLYFAFAIKGGELDTHAFGRDIGGQGAVALVGGALAVGTFLATAIGTRLRIRRPLAVQSSGLTITAGVGVLAALFYSLPMVALLALVTAIFSGIAKLAIDASIQERVPERLRASAFAHSETVLMMAWVVGGAVGIIPLAGRLGVSLVALFAVAAAVRAGFVAARLHNERLQGRPDAAAAPAGPTSDGPTAGGPTPDGPTQSRPTHSGPTQNGPTHSRPTQNGPTATPSDPWPDAPAVAPRPPAPPAPRDAGRERLGSEPITARIKAAPANQRDRTRTDGTRVEPTRVEPTRVEPTRADKRRGLLRRRPKAAPPPSPTPPRPDLTPPPPVAPDPALAPPGYHIYRPSSADSSTGNSHAEPDNR